MAGYQPGEQRSPDGGLAAPGGLSPEMVRAAQMLVETDARLAGGYRKVRDLAPLGISFTLHDVCWLSRSDCPLTAAPRGCHDGRHMAGVEGVSHTLEELRWFTTDQVRASGYDIAYCPRCGCRKSGHVEWTNHMDDGCSRETCRCHHNHDEGCLTWDGEQRCGWDS